MKLTIFNPARLTRVSKFHAFLPILFIAAANIGRSQEISSQLVEVSGGAIEVGNEVAISDSALVKVNFPNAPVQAIIPFYSSLTRKKLILDSSLQGEQLRIIAPKPLSKKDAIAFIEATLLLNGYALINIDSTTAKLINNGAGKSPTADGLKVYQNIRDVPANEEICHFFANPLKIFSARPGLSATPLSVTRAWSSSRLISRRVSCSRFVERSRSTTSLGLIFA